MGKAVVVVVVGGWLVGCLTSQRHVACICLARFTCCHTGMEVADLICHFSQSWYTDTSQPVLAVDCGSSQHQASVSERRICHDEIESEDPAYSIHSQSADTGLNSPRFGFRCLTGMLCVIETIRGVGKDVVAVVVVGWPLNVPATYRVYLRDGSSWTVLLM